MNNAVYLSLIKSTKTKINHYIMPHILFVIGYIILNAIFVVALFRAGRDMMKAIKQKKNQWVSICVIRIVLALCVLTWFNCQYFEKL